MQCPHCEASHQYIQRSGGTQRHNEFVLRYYVCRACGLRYITREVFHRPVYYSRADDSYTQPALRQPTDDPDGR